MLEAITKLKIVLPNFFILAFFILCMTGVGWFFGRALNGTSASIEEFLGLNFALNDILIGTVLILLSAMWFSIAVMLDDSFRLPAVASLVALFLMSLFLFPAPSIYMLVILPAWALLLLERLRMRHVLKDLMPWKPSWALHAGLPKFFLAINIIFTAALAVSPTALFFLRQPLPRSFIDQSLLFLSAPIQQYTGIDVNSTVDQTLNHLNEGKLTDPQLLTIARTEYSKKLNLPLTGKEKIKDVIFNVIDRQLNQFAKQSINIFNTGHINLFLLGFVASVFFTFQFFTWPANIISNIMTRILLFLLEA
ncbi:MAG TPA: hypothetical protein VI432_01640, partial [Candidatus Paceibacterota bacterium]